MNEDSGHVCDPEMMREHEQRITSNTEGVKRVDERITGVVKLIKDFTVEMRESNKNISDLVSEVRGLTVEVSHVVKATNKNTTEIEEIRDNMTYKDAVLDIYKTIEKSNEKHEKGMDAIMTQLRDHGEKQEVLEHELEEHKLEPALEALEQQQALKRWIIGGFGSVLIAIITLIATLIITGFFN